MEAAAPKKPRVALWIATGFGLGYLPVAPGTWGSLGGVALACGLPIFVFILFGYGLAGFFRLGSLAGPGTRSTGLAFHVPFLLVDMILSIGVGLIGVWASRHAAIHFRNSDPGPVVIDEISGQLITYLPLGALRFAGGGWKYLLLGFILFRIFDIVKPWPARAAEKWPHGWGIMADDWFAGMYAAIVLWLVRWTGWLG